MFLKYTALSQEHVLCAETAYKDRSLDAVFLSCGPFYFERGRIKVKCK
jgi:hypothetical protein